MDRDRLLAECRSCAELLRTAPSEGQQRLDVLREGGGEDPLLPAVIDLLQATAAFYLGRYHECERLARAARCAAEGLGEPRVVGHADNLLGNVAFERADYEDAAACYTRAAAAAEGSAADLGRVLNNLGLVAWRMRDLWRAEQHFERALAAFGPDADARILGNLQNNLGLVYEDRGEHDAAEAAWRAAIATLADAGDDNFLANALSNLAELKESRGRPVAARQMQERALALRFRLGHRRGVVGSRIALARIALATDDLDTAERELALALPAAREIGLRKHEADAVALSSRLQERRGDLAEALRLERLAAQLREQVFGEQMHERVGALEARFDVHQARIAAHRAEQENSQLQAALAAVEAACAARSQFLAMMSHEMRTPLTSAIAAAELLRTHDLPEAESRLADVIVASAEALLATIDDVLDFSKIEAGHLRLASDAASPREVAEQVIAIVSPAGAAKGLAVQLQLDPGLPDVVTTDRSRLRQVLLNLLSNAVKFTEIGHVALTIGYADGLLTCEVADTGIGMEPAVIARLFEPFTQADLSSTRRHGGSGLGLAISARIVAAMHGELSVRSVPGGGSTFRVTLPLLQAVAAPRPASPPRARQGCFTTLLVDDDDMVREVLEDLLKWCGTEVVAVPSAFAALERFAEVHPDLVVLDVHMPGMDGLACARALRADHGYRGPILGLSGATATRDQDAAREAGFDAWLGKPVTLAQLRGALTRFGL